MTPPIVRLLVSVHRLGLLVGLLVGPLVGPLLVGLFVCGQSYFPKRSGSTTSMLLFNIIEILR